MAAVHVHRLLSPNAARNLHANRALTDVLGKARVAVISEMSQLFQKVTRMATSGAASSSMQIVREGLPWRAARRRQHRTAVPKAEPGHSKMGLLNASIPARITAHLERLPGRLEKTDYRTVTDEKKPA